METSTKMKNGKYVKIKNIFIKKQNEFKKRQSCIYTQWHSFIFGTQLHIYLVNGSRRRKYCTSLTGSGIIKELCNATVDFRYKRLKGDDCNDP